MANEREAIERHDGSRPESHCCTVHHQSTDTYGSSVQHVPPTRRHLDTYMDPSSGTNTAVKRRPKQARQPKQKCRNVSQESFRLSFCVNQRSNPDVSGRETDGSKMNCPLPRHEGTFSDRNPSRSCRYAWPRGSGLFIRDPLSS
jgi:hypothetical protein